MQTADVSTEKTGLAAKALDSLRGYFAAQDHWPSPGHWHALAAIADTMEAMVCGTCQPVIHLSAVDPGVGKSRTVIHFAKELVASPDHHRTGIFISVFTIAEAKAMAAALQDIRASLCVMTSDPEANALGGAMLPDTAQVLITTQNRLGRLTEDQPFRAATAFFYRGEPRACRVWDESVLPGSAIVLGADDLLGVASRLRPLSPTLTDALYDLGDAVRRADDGAAIEVPDFTASCGICLPDVTSYLAPDNGTTDRERDREAALALLLVNGRRVRVRRDGRNGAAMLTFREELPADLFPMLVLDASGRVRETYNLWMGRPGQPPIHRLPEAVRDYSPLTVRVWRTGGGKDSWSKNSNKLLAGIAATILTKPEEDWLVVLHKPNSRMGRLEAALKGLLSDVVGARVSVTTWGRHTGINSWADVPNVILAGTLFYPDSHLTALHHLCANLPVEAGLVSREEVERTARGEHRHLILQAICRGRVRRSDGDRCQPMNAYIIASQRSGIPAEISSVFPGCQVEEWSPVKERPKGKLAEAIAYLTKAVEAGRTEVSYPEVYAAIEMDKANFSRRVAKTKEWEETVVSLNAEVVRGPKGALLVKTQPGPDQAAAAA